MTRRTPLSIVATAVAAGCAGPGSPSPADTLTYEVPSPPSAVYHIGDTMSIDLDTPAGSVAVSGAGSATIGLAFQADPGGLRVVGTVEAFAGSMTNPMVGTQTAGLDDLSGNLEVVVRRHGVAELVSFPVLSGPAAQMSSFPLLAYLLFPRMPAGDVGPGTSWMDTVNSSTDTEGVSTTTTAVSTYTLVGDTVVDGRSLVHIAVATELTTETVTQEVGMSIARSEAGSTDGFVLWDPERRLVARAEYERDLEGTLSMGAMGSMGMAITGPTRIRLEG